MTLARTSSGLLVAASVLGLAACGDAASSAATSAAELRVPELGPVPALPEWSDDPSTPAKVELGRALFHDVRLSGSGNTSCDRCHTAAASFQDNLIGAVPDSVYPAAQPHLARNTSSMLNLVQAPIFRWDGSHTDLLEVLVFPFAEPNMNLGTDVPSAQEALKKRLTEDLPEYVPRFSEAFGEDLPALQASAVWDLGARALRAFLRGATSRDAPFDRWNAGDDDAMGAEAVRGLAVFRGRGQCILCHSGPFFTDFAFHNVSTAPPDATGARADEGRYLVSGRELDRGAFLTPTLRGAIDTSPYFHDGSHATLRKVLTHFSTDAVLKDPLRDPIFASPLPLSETDIDDLIELLRALRGTPVGENLGPPEE